MTAKYGKKLSKTNILRNGANPHICYLCVKPFTISDSLSRHKRIQSWAKSNKCDLCIKTYTVPGSLTRYNEFNHEQNHTNVTCVVCSLVVWLDINEFNHAQNHTNVTCVLRDLLYLVVWLNTTSSVTSQIDQI